MKLNDFFSKHPVFTVAELDEYLRTRGSGNRKVRTSMLTYHRRQGRIVPVRRGLYAVVPPGADPESVPVDPYLLASKLTSDAVLGYHTTLEFFGRAYSVYQRFFYLSKRPSAPLRFRSYEFKGILVPKALRDKGKESFGVKSAEREGIPVKVTDLERTMVDVLDRPDLCGGWEEVWRSLESIEYFNLDEVVEYTLLLGNSTTAAKVGFFLEQHQDSLMVKDPHLDPLRELRPRQPHYMERNKRHGGRLLPEWNLVVPETVLKRSWAEVT